MLSLLFYIPAWGLTAGIMQIVTAIRIRKEIEGEVWLILAGIASVVFSIGDDLADLLVRDRVRGAAGDLRDTVGREAAPRGVEAYRERLDRRLQELAIAADPQRLAQEVVLFADRSDVSEELTRLSTHAAKFGEILAEAGAVGRRLDFLLQEMHREANTIGAKIQDAELSQEVVEIKAELERMREQVQNLE